MFLYRDRKTPRKPEWQPERQPRRPEDRERDLSRVLPGEGDSVDPYDYYVEGNPIDRAPPARAADLQPAKGEPRYTAIPKSLGHDQHCAFEPDPRVIARARRVSKQWFKLTPKQRHRLWQAYTLLDYGVDWGTEAEHRAFRRAGFPEKGPSDAEMLLKVLGGYFSDERRDPEAAALLAQLTPLLREVHDAA
jgi:hypothetical protein